MTAETSSWWKKAEGDYSSMRKEFSAPSNFDATCFHAQQCVEKLIKAILIERKIQPPYIHNLLALARLLDPMPKGLDFMFADLQVLSNYAVSIRYPLDFANKHEAQEAMDICVRARSILLAELGIPDLFEE